MITVIIPIRTKSVGNLREHWRARAKRSQTERGIVRLSMLSQAPDLEGCGKVVAVRFTRVAPRVLDTDNLAAAHKAIRDAVAAYLGVSDAPSGGVHWTYDQTKGGAGEYMTIVEIEGAA